MIGVNRLSPRACAVFSFVIGAAIAGAAVAQPYPNKPIRIIVAATPADSIDYVARVVGQKLGAAFGQQIIIDNRGGAGGNIAAEVTAKASPDGYTLLGIAANLAINPSLYRKLAYDPVKDLAPITQFTAAGYILALHPSVPAKTVKEFIALAKSRKGGITYASSGSGQAQHLGMELLKTVAGFDAVHIPYKGGAPTVLALIAGEADAALLSTPSALPQLKTGKMRALAMTSLKRLSLLPDVPTIAEAGLPGFEVSGWIGLLAPAGTPREVASRLQGEIARILKLPDISTSMTENGQETIGSTPEQFGAYPQAEITKWEKVVRQSGARAD